jgi:hypothetical protein
MPYTHILTIPAPVVVPYTPNIINQSLAAPSNSSNGSIPVPPTLVELFWYTVRSDHTFVRLPNRNTPGTRYGRG